MPLGYDLEVHILMAQWMAWGCQRRVLRISGFNREESRTGEMGVTDVYGLVCESGLDMHLRDSQTRLRMMKHRLLWLMWHELSTFHWSGESCFWIKDTSHLPGKLSVAMSLNTGQDELSEASGSFWNFFLDMKGELDGRNFSSHLETWGNLGWKKSKTDCEREVPESLMNTVFDLSFLNCLTLSCF